MKTVLAPNAPWYVLVEPKPKPAPKPKPGPRNKRATPKQIDANFDKWLKTVEPVKC